MITAYALLTERPTSHVERSCSSKVLLSSRREAISRIRHGRHQDGSLHPYHCTFCGAWHLGHRVRRR